LIQLPTQLAGVQLAASVPAERKGKRLEWLHFSRTLLFFSPLMNSILQRGWIRAGLLCYNVHSGECALVKLCAFRKTVGREKGHESRHVF